MPLHLGPFVRWRSGLVLTWICLFSSGFTFTGSFGPILGFSTCSPPASMATPFRKDAVSRRNQRSGLSPERLIVFFPEVLSVARESWSTVDLESRCI
ncbi:hypothetical protein QQF64_007058 [Cirrhinus molitorella]|uniref:Secreted protein n=1 Tax=Cirrhinus molitorella TaxID=172907 RepID=A0ABR3M9K5_9TELE